MPITIGAPPEHGFDTPLGLLSDCHRRIEKFLDLLLRVTDEAGGGALTPPQREAMATALRYFEQAAPLHTRDEEESLFPRLRASADSDAQAALSAVAALEADHDAADVAHAAVDALGRRWLEAGTLNAAEATQLRGLLQDLRESYRHHIAVEDTQVFPTAARALPPGEVAAVGREMALRRGLDPDALPPASHCVSRRPRHNPPSGGGAAPGRGPQ